MADTDELVEAEVDAEDEQQLEHGPAAEGEREPVAEVADAEAEQQAVIGTEEPVDTEVSFEVDPQPEVDDVAEEQQAEEQPADVDVVDTEELVGAEMTAEDERQLEAEVADADVHETKELVEAAGSAEDEQQPEARRN